MGFRNWAYPLDCRVMNRQSAWWDKSALLSRYGGAWTSKTLDEDIDELRQRVARLEARLDQRDDSG